MNVQSNHIYTHVGLFLNFFPALKQAEIPCFYHFLSFFFFCSAPIPSSHFLDLWDGIPGMSPVLVMKEHAQTLPGTAPLRWADNDNNGAARRRHKGHKFSTLDVYSI